MVNITVIVCRFCLKAAEDSDIINGSERDIIQIVIPRIELDYSDNHRICKNCARLLKQSFDFKSKCLEIEDSIHDFKKEGQIPINLEKSLGIKDATRSLRICRTCSEYLKNNAYVELNSRSGLHSIFKKCLPEMDIELTVEPVICLSCHHTLKTLFNLITLCEANEEKLRFDFDVDHVKKNSCEINKDHAEMPDIQNIYATSSVTATGKTNSTGITEKSKVTKVLSDDNINNEIYIVSIPEENDNNIKTAETSNKNKVERCWLASEKECSENIVLNDISYFSYPTNTEGNISNSEPDLPNKKVGNENLENSKNTFEIGENHSQVRCIQNILLTKNLTGSKKDFTSTAKGLLSGIDKNEIYIVSDSDENGHNIKATETSKKRKTRGNKITRSNLTRLAVGEISSNDSDCSWVDSGNSTDSSGQWFSTPKKYKRTKKQKLVPTKPIQLKNSVFCKYCFFSTTSTWAINRHISNCPSSPFSKNLTKTSIERNGTPLEKSNAGILLINLPGNLPFYEKPYIQENNIAVTENIEELSEETTTESPTPNILEGEENVETVQSEVSNYIRETRSYEMLIKKDFLIHERNKELSGFNCKASNRNGHELKSNNLKSILTTSKKKLEDCFIVATEGTCIEPKPSRVNSKRTRRSEDRIKRESLKLVAKINKKQPKDGLNVTIEGTCTELEPLTLNFEGIPEEQHPKNKTFNVVKDAVNIVENCAAESTGRNFCEPIINKDSLTMIAKGISVEQADSCEVNSKTIHSEKDLIKSEKMKLLMKINKIKALKNGPIVITERTSNELESSSSKFKSNIEHDQTNKHFSILTDNAKNVENVSNCTEESTEINAGELFINKDCPTMATEGTSTEVLKYKKSNNKEHKDRLTATIERTSTELNSNFKDSVEEQDQAIRVFSIPKNAVNLINSLIASTEGTTELESFSLNFKDTENKTSNDTGERIGINSCELFFNNDCLTVATQETSMEERVEKSNIAMTANIKKPAEETESRLNFKKTGLNFKNRPEKLDQMNRAFNILKDTVNFLKKRTSNCTEEVREINSCELITNKDCLTVATAGISVEEPEPSGPKSKGIQREGVLRDRENLKPAINENSKLKN